MKVLCAAVSKYKHWFKLLPPQSNWSHHCHAVLTTDRDNQPTRNVMFSVYLLITQTSSVVSGFWLMCVVGFKSRGMYTTFYNYYYIIFFLISKHLIQKLRSLLLTVIFYVSKSLLWIIMLQLPRHELRKTQTFPIEKIWGFHYVTLIPMFTDFLEKLWKRILSWGCLKSYTQKSECNDSW